ncbi:MAG: GMC oxidoreductase [Desulfobacterales bacterium]|jgi:choline dehydrogenase-like flavoprotein
MARGNGIDDDGSTNLFVADGSVVPANLGVNSSLTITALSEYIMSQLPPKMDSQ